MGTLADAKEILGNAGIPEAILQALLLPFGFKVVGDRRNLSPTKGRLALGAGLASLVVSIVVVVLMVPTAWRSLTNSGPVQPTLVFFVMLLLVFVGCGVAAVVLLRTAWDYYGKAK